MTTLVETAIIAFTTFFATIGPIDVAVVFAVLTAKATPAERRSMALRGTLIAGGILLLFGFFGQAVLDRLGISLAALRTSGGILLLLIAIDMVFARASGGVGTTDEEEQEATTKTDIAIFPLATPLIAGPGAMGAVILLMAQASSDFQARGVVVLMLIMTLLLTLVMLLGATQIHRVVGVTALNVITRVFGVLLAALAVQFIFDGIAQSGLF